MDAVAAYLSADIWCSGGAAGAFPACLDLAVLIAPVIVEVVSVVTVVSGWLGKERDTVTTDLAALVRFIVTTCVGTDPAVLNEASRGTPVSADHVAIVAFVDEGVEVKTVAADLRADAGSGAGTAPSCLYLAVIVAAINHVNSLFLTRRRSRSCHHRITLRFRARRSRRLIR